jgi:hypothetical protein
MNCWTLTQPCVGRDRIKEYDFFDKSGFCIKAYFRTPSAFQPQSVQFFKLFTAHELTSGSRKVIVVFIVGVLLIVTQNRFPYCD